MSGTRRPRCLDLFCGAGGASKGYYDAGFDVVGVDIVPQKNYPFLFVQGDALSMSLEGFDLIHASPPCQRYSGMSHCRSGLSNEYPDLVGLVRNKLCQSGVPFVIENVEGAPLINPIVLCGRMFGLKLYRHRLFESNFTITPPEHSFHDVPASKAGHWRPGTIMSVAGHIAPISVAREAMGIDWMNRAELAEAIPPAYTEYVGQYALSAVLGERYY